MATKDEAAAWMDALAPDDRAKAEQLIQLAGKARFERIASAFSRKKGRPEIEEDERYLEEMADLIFTGQVRSVAPAARRVTGCPKGTLTGRLETKFGVRKKELLAAAKVRAERQTGAASAKRPATLMMQELAAFAPLPSTALSPALRAAIQIGKDIDQLAAMGRQLIAAGSTAKATKLLENPLIRNAFALTKRTQEDDL